MPAFEYGRGLSGRRSGVIEDGANTQTQFGRGPCQTSLLPDYLFESALS